MFEPKYISLYYPNFEFGEEYFVDGKIDWEQLVRSNSAINMPKRKEKK